ncbi:MAG: nucleoside 2-deoxyribosyltransferase [Anaerolinea thermophila]|uniref:Putative 2'-deoxynucleoside 5'-phosphate N-hydrolase 1 n=1 Tax=Anaerolinea thermophila TaxID=167964 RepID=A0A101FY07_9CHLR|nr:MAG: nucleoside 2-deoxyribosyltransferase [Anaerolinea thermophila]
MQVYFSCSITGGRAEQQIYQMIVQHMEQQGLSVPTAHLAQVGVVDEESIIEAPTVYRRDVDWVIQSDIIVAEVSTPSHGVGYELAVAEFHDKPIFCCYQLDRKVSKMILGNDYPYLQIYAYREIKDLLDALDAFLADFL